MSEFRNQDLLTELGSIRTQINEQLAVLEELLAAASSAVARGLYSDAITQLKAAREGTYRAEVAAAHAGRMS